MKNAPEFKIWFSNFGYFANEGQKYQNAAAAIAAGKEHNFSFIVVTEEEKVEFAKTIVAQWEPLVGLSWFIPECER